MSYLLVAIINIRCQQKISQNETKIMIQNIHRERESPVCLCGKELKCDDDFSVYTEKRHWPAANSQKMS